MTRSRLFFVVVWIALVIPMVVEAQNTPAPDPRHLFAEGVELLQQQRFADAVQRLEQARALLEAPAVLFNLALAQRGLGRYVDADRTIARYLELSAGRLRSHRRREIDALRAEVRAAIAQLVIRVDALPASATVSLDGRRLADAEINHPIEVDPVEHVARVEGAGLEVDERRQSLAPGQHGELRLTLRPFPPPVAIAPIVERRPRDSALVVESTVAEATVYLDRRPVGQGAFRTRVAPGVHEIEVRLDDYETFHLRLTVIADHDERVFAPLRRRPQSIATRWWFWTGIGVVAAGTATALAFGLSSTEPPTAGSLNRVVQAITF